MADCPGRERDLFTVIVALRQWGELHAFAPDETHSVLIDEHGLPLPRLQPIDSTGDPADVDTTSVRKGSPWCSRRPIIGPTTIND